MIELTQQQQKQICADLALAMGWTASVPVGFTLPTWTDPESDANHQYAPNPFTSAEDSRALVEWLATQSLYIQDKFNTSIVQAVTPYGMTLKAIEAMTAPLPIIALAVHRALGLEVKE